MTQVLSARDQSVAMWLQPEGAYALRDSQTSVSHFLLIHSPSDQSGQVIENRCRRAPDPMFFVV